jgi:hypothetical protein
MGRLDASPFIAMEAQGLPGPLGWPLPERVASLGTARLDAARLSMASIDRSHQHVCLDFQANSYQLFE